MWETLVWWRRLDQEPAAESIRWLREETLRFLLRVALAGFLAWHVLGLLFRSGPDLPTAAIVRAWLLAGVVVAGLGAATLAAEHRWRIAPALFLGTSLVAVTAAIWLLEAPAAANLYPLVSLAAVVLLHPLAGLATAAAGASLLAGLRALVPSLGLPDALPVEAGWLALLTVVVAWALGRNLVLAVEWSVRSSRAAERHAAEARANRAELVQALKQLDHAYYRLQRANAALELAWKAAEEAERARAEFVTNISHELRTPLNLIAGFSELVLTSPESYAEELPPSYRGDLQAIYRSAQHLLTLTNDVIDLARVGMGRLALVREAVDLASVISDACAIVREYIAAKGLGLRVEVAPDLPTLTIDRLRIRQVLLNLLTNAARFTERGEITVAANREGEEVRVEVRDTGRGMAPEALERVFEEFGHGGGQHPGRRLDLLVHPADDESGAVPPRAGPAAARCGVALHSRARGGARLCRRGAARVPAAAPGRLPGDGGREPDMRRRAGSGGARLRHPGRRGKAPGADAL